MTHVVVINGPAGVGKTTISGHLANLHPGTMNVSGDALLSFGPANVRDFLGSGSTYRASASLISTYLSMGARRVLFDYVFDTRDKIWDFCRWLPATTPIYFFTVWAPFDTVVHREASREGREPLGERVFDTYRSLERNLHGLGEVIENTGAPDEVAAQILAMIAASKGIEGRNISTVEIFL